jgi:hypothetical protein
LAAKNRLKYSGFSLFRITTSQIALNFTRGQQRVKTKLALSVWETEAQRRERKIGIYANVIPRKR